VHLASSADARRIVGLSRQQRVLVGPRPRSGAVPSATTAWKGGMALMSLEPVLTDDGKRVFTEELQSQTRPRGGWTGRLRESSAERVILVDRPLQQVLPHLWDIKNVEYCERKADDVQVSTEQSWTGRYVIRGRILGVIPWQGPFRYVLHERGFHSEDAVTRRGGLRVNGGFTAEAADEATRVWHYERYLLPWPVAALKPLVTAYVRWTQRREMCDLKSLIERDGSPAAAS
jgi:hypothetical protein